MLPAPHVSVTLRFLPPHLAALHLDDSRHRRLALRCHHDPLCNQIAGVKRRQSKIILGSLKLYYIRS